MLIERGHLFFVFLDPVFGKEIRGYKTRPVVVISINDISAKQLQTWTVKSDDVEGRTKIYESMVKGENTLDAGTPASFDVLTNEIRGLGLNMQLEKKRG